MKHIPNHLANGSCACDCAECVAIVESVGCIKRRICICKGCNHDCTDYRGVNGDVELGLIK